MFPQMLLSISPTSSNPRPVAPAQLLSTRDPLSIPITTVNFRRFVSKVGPVFWLQDRIEEILMWKKGWKATCVWIAAYAFLCYFPRLVLLLPHALLAGIMLATYPRVNQSLPPSKSNSARTVPPPPPANVGEGSVDWQANLQAIQNLMGACADLHDVMLNILPHITHSSPYTPFILTITIATFLLAIPLLPLLPLRPIFLVLGLTPFVFTHPFTREHILPLVSLAARDKINRARLQRLVDDDKLEDRHLRSELREVELWENERWCPGAEGEAGSWKKSNLRPTERSAWTRGRDGWSGVKEDGGGQVSSNLTFSLAPGWAFVETEDWRPDLEGNWIQKIGSDDCGWVYTNDAWLDPHRVHLESWKSSGMTRRRRWTRRIYYCPSGAK
ncbi:Peroxin/Dysferlin domain-containing protein [Hygrophoropsis aurantiaca]|uniref:Peroxin/Dysferlin domain-containing protein n=1 Tax=Hygrophoropsis aurantiaca TaxID=72124 RepID=A0ACB8ADR9_9AGAM|nr:Peroxin/Dysferlin domain-containing protein [Hygrophoropsis aurantiaca]